jgi:hypothetical protein
LPTFLSQDQVYRILQRELPDNVYPDGAAAAYYSTADNAAIAEVAATGYGTLNQVYLNYFPQTCDDVSINAWEIKAFGYNNDASLGLAARQNLVIQKLRTRLGLTIGDMLGIVRGVLGPSVIIEIAPWSAPYGSWILGANQLGITTILGSGPRLRAASPYACDLGAAYFGLTAAQWAGIQADAYTYSVLIYAYIPTAAQLALINSQLTIYEPGRSTHVILSGLDPAKQIFTVYPVIDGGGADDSQSDDIDGGGAADGGGAGGPDGGPG